VCRHWVMTEVLLLIKRKAPKSRVNHKYMLNHSIILIITVLKKLKWSWPVTKKNTTWSWLHNPTMGASEESVPAFTQKPQLRQEDDGNRLIFECQLIGSPQPEITWFRGDVELSPNKRTFFKTTSISGNKYLVVLELDNVIESDAGLYRVKAKNKQGEVFASINLNFSRKSFIILLKLS